MDFQEVLTKVKEILDIELFSVQSDPITIGSILIFIIFLTAFLTLGSITRRVLQNKFLKRFDIDQGLQFTLARVAQYIIIIIGVLISFQFLEINLTSLAVVFGLLSVGIGFGLQNITANFISGLIIMFERPISVGDRVQVGDKEGDVTEISIRSTMIRTLNNISIIVPNSEFVEFDVVNFSHGDPTFRLDISVGVSYSSDLDTVLKALNEVAEEHPKVMEIPEHRVHLINFGDSAWDMQLQVWIPNVKERYILRNEINQAIVRKFKEHKIEIPFPQRDLHLRSSISFPIEKSATEKSEPENSSAIKPATEKSEPENSSAIKPATEEPKSEKSSAEKPGEKKPESEKPGEIKPGAEKTDAEKSVDNEQDLK